MMPWRPTFARLLLREVADVGRDDRPSVLRHVQPFIDLVEDFVHEQARTGETDPFHIDPAHMASTIAGATVFFVAAMPAGTAAAVPSAPRSPAIVSPLSVVAVVDLRAPPFSSVKFREVLPKPRVL